MSAMPWFKFFPTNWRADAALRMCSPVARCLWIEMLCLMAEAEPMGHLLVKGKQLTPRALAVAAGMSVDEVEAGLAELEENEVFSRTSAGVIFSRKMVKDAVKSDQQRAKAEKRWGTENIGEIDAGNANANAVGKETARAKPMPKKLEARDHIDQEREAGVDLFGEAAAPLISPADQALALYNEVALRVGGSIAQMTEERRTKLNARMNGRGFPLWREAMKMVEVSPFLCGEIPPRDGKRQFKLDLDFLLQPSSFVKLIEGKYGDERRPGETPTGPGDWPSERWAKAFQNLDLGDPWPKNYGPPPGRPGCFAPADMAHAYLNRKS